MSEKITICSVGDLMIGDSPLYVSVGVGSKYATIREKLVNVCRELFRNADVAIGNLETVVSFPKNNSLKERQMSCPESAIEDLRTAGVSILNLANNHCLQHGVDGFNTTKNVCSKNGIEPIGLRNQEPKIVTIKGRKLAFLSLCIHLEWYEPENILYEDRIKYILDEVRILKTDHPDIVIIVSVHWGDEFAKYPSAAQIALAHKLVDVGATVILGHHSHVFQGIEEYKDAVIVYSQGNFVSDMVPQICRETGVISIEIDDNVSYKLHPLLIGENMIPAPDKGIWFQERTELLNNALKNEIKADQYWRDVLHNHAAGHNDFKVFFKKNICKYEKAIAAKMILDFAGRKLRRIIGTSSDGQVSSMDPEIMRTLKEYK